MAHFTHSCWGNLSLLITSEYVYIPRMRPTTCSFFLLITIRSLFIEFCHALRPVIFKFTSHLFLQYIYIYYLHTFNERLSIYCVAFETLNNFGSTNLVMATLFVIINGFTYRIHFYSENQGYCVLFRARNRD